MSSPTPVAPTLSLSTDAPTYSVGSLLTLTADYSDSSAAPLTLTISATAVDANGVSVSATTTATVNTAEQLPMTVTPSDSFDDDYAEVSNTAGVAVFTTTIQAPPAAPPAVPPANA